MSISSRTVRTPKPSLRSLVVEVPDENLVRLGGELPREGVLYGDNASWKILFGQDFNLKFSGFRYVKQLEDSRAGARLLFVKSMTDEERNLPFRTTSKFGNHYWHPILKELRFLPVGSFPNTAQTGAATFVSAVRYLVRETFIPAMHEGTRFEIDEFFSDTKFSIPQYPVPTPTAISYHFVNLRGGFPECLHRKIDIAALAAVVGASVQEGQVFPATNFIEWQPYYVLDDQDLTDSGYYRQRKRAFPPPQPKVIVRIG